MFTVVPPPRFAEHVTDHTGPSGPPPALTAARNALVAAADRPITGFVIVGVVLLAVVLARWIGRFVVRMTEISALLRVSENLRVARNALSGMFLVACVT